MSCHSGKPLAGKVCLVTGASRGIGKGIALQLGQAGAVVYVTGRRPEKSDKVGGSLQEAADEVTARGGQGIAAYCDHSDDKDIKALFDKIQKEQDGRLDILVNNAYSAVTALQKNHKKKFWEIEPEIWDTVNNVGLRNHYFCSVYAARMMVERKSGLIVNVSSPGGLRYFLNVAYGVGKEALDRMAADMGIELRSSGVTVVSLWPGPVKTELIVQAQNRDEDDPMSKVFKNGESVEFSGKAVVALSTDPELRKKSGKIVLTAELGDEYGFHDIDGRHIDSMRSLKVSMSMAGLGWIAAWLPSWVKLPYTVFASAGHKF